MALYAIGDVQGCYDDLQRLLDKIHFDPADDEVWFTGDLVNRGPRSSDVLRFVAGLGDRAISVMGNHDLHLLAAAAGVNRDSPSDTFHDILCATDRDELLAWLAARPFIFRHPARELYVVHAGILPQWTMTEAQACAREAEHIIRGPEASKFFEHMYGNDPAEWSDTLAGWERIRLIVNVFTRLRFCRRNGAIDLQYKGAPGSQPDYLVPWFDVPQRKNLDAAIVFGHWSALGLKIANGVIGIDTGCLWGRQLTAVQLDSEIPLTTSVECRGSA